MVHSRAPLALTLTLVLTSMLTSLPGQLWAKQAGLSPARIKQIAETSKSFEACRKDAITLLKQNPNNRKLFENALISCKENFPGADLYITCKKQAMQAANAKSATAEQATQQCQRYLVAASFDPGLPVPFFTEAGQAFFAGIGLNSSLPISALNPPNFTCQKVRSVAQDPKKAEYFLFGNHPRLFSSLSGLKAGELMNALQLKKLKADRTDVPGFGRLYGDPRRASANLYFPMAPCDLGTKTGKIMNGLSIYYLMDQLGTSVTPYFGIAYYHKDQTATTTARLIAAVSKTLGPDFKLVKSNGRFSFIGLSDITEVDEEQDPKNLCRSPRTHKLLGVVASYLDRPTQPEYLILANIKNLCEFGDRLAKRLLPE